MIAEREHLRVLEGRSIMRRSVGSATKERWSTYRKQRDANDARLEDSPDSRLLIAFESRLQQAHIVGSVRARSLGALAGGDREVGI